MSAYSRTVIAALAPLVSQAAEEGDAVAAQIVDEAAAKLTWFVEGVHRSLSFTGELVVIAYIGGVFKSRPLLRAFEERVSKAFPCQVQRPSFNPAGGAVLEALRLDGNGSELLGVPESEK